MRKERDENVMISNTMHNSKLSSHGIKFTAAVLATLCLLYINCKPSVTYAKDKDIVDKGANDIAYDISPANDGTNIAVGENAKVFIGGGTQEAILSFGETVAYTNWGLSMNIHGNDGAKQNLPAGIAVGSNTYARTGSIQIGDHTLEKNKIAIGDTTADKLRQFGVASTTLGTNSYTGGGFATTIGSYNVQSSPYEAKGTMDTFTNSTKNAFSTVVGTLNSNESMTGSSNSGVSNVITGNANKIKNSNGAIAIGAGNIIEESISYINSSVYSTHYDSVAAMQKAMIDGVASNAGGATLVVGGANKAKYTYSSQLIGVGNELEGDNNTLSAYNMLNGYKNKASNVQHVSVIGTENEVKNTNGAVVFGDKRILNTADGSIILGSSANSTITDVKNAVAIGSESNVTKEGGVALGVGAVASVDKGVAGYDSITKAASTDDSSTWKSTAAAISVGNAEEGITRQITNVAAGYNDTDAVNVAQLKKAVSSAVADGNDTLVADDNALSFSDGKISLYIKDTADNTVTGSISLAEISSAVADGNTTYEMQYEENNDNTTTITLKDSNDIASSVTVATRDTRNTVSAGNNVSVDERKNTDGSSNFTVSVKADGKVEEGNTGIISGDTVYKETRVQIDGTYVKKDNTTGDNITALDTQVKRNTDDITNIGNQINNMEYSLNKLDGRLDKVGAGAAALAALHPLDFDPDEKLTFSAGMGNYRGENAAALGMFYRPDEKTMFSLGGTIGNGENMVNVGVSFALDRTSSVNNSKVAMAKDIVTLRDQVSQLTELVSQMAVGQGMINEVYKLFPDVPENHWAYEYIEGLVNAGLIEGYPNGEFGGDRMMTRYEFAAMLYRALEKGVVLDGKIIKEFEGELGRIRIDRISGQDNKKNKIERVRVIVDKNRDNYGSQINNNKQ